MGSNQMHQIIQTNVGGKKSQTLRPFFTIGGFGSRVQLSLDHESGVLDYDYF